MVELIEKCFATQLEALAGQSVPQVLLGATFAKILQLAHDNVFRRGEPDRFFGQAQPALASHSAQNRKLLRACLFIR